MNRTIKRTVKTSGGRLEVAAIFPRKGDGEIIMGVTGAPGNWRIQYPQIVFVVRQRGYKPAVYFAADFARFVEKLKSWDAQGADNFLAIVKNSDIFKRRYQ